MLWEVEVTDEFKAWWNSLTLEEQIRIDAAVRFVEEHGPALGRPHADTVKISRHPNMKELRVQYEGRPYRIFFAFDPRRNAILLIGGDKTGTGRFYETFVPLADRLYDEYLEDLRREGLIDGENEI